MNNQFFQDVLEIFVSVLRYLIPFFPILLVPFVWNITKRILLGYTLVDKEEKNVKSDETIKSEIKPYIDDMSITATVDNLINADRQDLLEWYYEHMNEME